MDFRYFPAELKALPQWCAAGSGDPSSRFYKAPINPHTKQWAKVDDPTTWGTLEQALAAGYPLVGFVLSQNDPYSAIDLDTYKAANEQVQNLHAEILRNAGTYNETSQSGFGTHIIGIGHTVEGARNEANAVEIYSSGRFMICTGHTSESKPIADIQPLLDYLYPLMKHRTGGVVNWRDLGAGTDSGLSDEEVVLRASNAENGEKFDALCRGDLSGHDNDHSKADMALIMFLCFHSSDNEQVERLFHMSALGQRDKAFRRDYVPRTIARARKMLENDAPPPVDMTAIAERARNAAASAHTQGDSAQPAPAPINALPRPTTFPPGLVGEIAEYALASSTRPVPEIALATAIATLAGVVGRQYNVSTPGTGLNQYILLLAVTGTGKESVQGSVDRLFHEICKTTQGAERFLGPAHFASGPALVKQFDEHPCFVSILGEIGIRIKNMMNPRANSAEKTLMAAMLDLFSKSGMGQMMRSSVYSDKEKNSKTVYSPCLTILGETAPEPFFAGLDEQAIASGFLPRFLMIEYKGGRPKRNPHPMAVPPPELVQKMSDLCTAVLRQEQAQACHSVAIEPDAKALLDAFDLEVDDEMERGGDETTRHLWNRAHLKALRLAALVAVGVNPYDPRVTTRDAEWAIGMVRSDVAVLQSRFQKGDIGEGDSKQRLDLIEIVKRFLANGSTQYPATYQADGCIPRRYLITSTANRPAFRNDRRGATKALKDLLEEMVTSGDLQLLPKDQARTRFQTTGAIYCLGDQWNGG